VSGPRPEPLDVYRRLLAVYGPQGWWPFGSAQDRPGNGDPFEVVVGAILTQNTAWANVERALARLRTAGVLSVDGIRGIDEAALAELIRPSGYFNGKARKLKAFVAMVDAEFGGDLATLLALPLAALRPQLLATHGIGPETADAIALYAAGRPAFVVDAYTRRIADRLGLAPPARTYEGYRRCSTSTTRCSSSTASGAA
jgi:endonuclease-3 related protein